MKQQMKKLKEERKKGNTEAQVLAIPHDARGRPPMLLELDSKLIFLLQSIRSRGGVINYSVVKATVVGACQQQYDNKFGRIRAYSALGKVYLQALQLHTPSWNYQASTSASRTV